MPFQPKAGDTLIIDNVQYHFAEHPAAEGMPYGQEGRAAIVYQLTSEQGSRALKTFKPRFRRPSLVALSERISRFANLQGLRTCARTVLTARRYADLLQEYPDLTYAVLMRWIDGPTWAEVVLDKQPLTVEESLLIARTLTEILAGMEEQGVAHCDLSGPNVLIPALAKAHSSDLDAVELVDVEQLYGPGLERPDLLLAGSQGYAAYSGEHGDLWSAKADRFAGAMLLGEMLGWCDDAVREAAWSETYFDPDEMQHADSKNYHLLVDSLGKRWGSGVADLFADAWRSATLDDCPTFGEWLLKLPRAAASMAQDSAAVGISPVSASDVNALMAQASQLQAKDDLVGALQSYRLAQQAAPPGSSLAVELGLIATNLEAQLPPGSFPTPPVPATSTSATESAPPQQPSGEIDRLYDFAVAATERQEWRGAQEMLREVVRRQPDYSRNGQAAAVLLAAVDSRVASGASPVINTPAPEVAPSSSIVAPAPVAAETQIQSEPLAVSSSDSAMAAVPSSRPARTTNVRVSAPATRSFPVALVGGIVGVLVLVVVGGLLFLTLGNNKPTQTLQVSTAATSTVQNGTTGNTPPTTAATQVIQVDAGATSTAAQAAIIAQAAITPSATQGAQTTTTTVIVAQIPPTATTPASTPTSSPLPAGPQPAGVVTFQDSKQPSNQITAVLDPAPTIQPGKGLMGWLVNSSNGQTLRVGRLLSNAGSTLKVTYTAPDKTNLLSLYDGFEVSAEDLETEPITPSADIVLSGQLPLLTKTHIGHVLVSDPALPGQASVEAALPGQLDLVNQHARFMSDNQSKGNLIGVKQHAEHMVNMIEGVKGPNFGDVNNDGKVQNPGDGVGLLIGNNQLGYLQHLSDHVDNAAAVTGVSDDLKMHAAGVDITVENMRDWETQIRDLSLQIAAANDLNTTKPLVDQIVQLAGLAINGKSTGSQNQVVAEPGISGVVTSYQEAQLMATIRLHSGGAVSMQGGGQAAEQATTPAQGQQAGTVATLVSASVTAPAITQAITQKIDIIQSKFGAPLTVKVGTTVVWTNQDSIAHSVISDDYKSFDSGILQKGQSFSYISTTPGEFKYYCAIHGGPGGQGMSSSIVVEP